LLALILAGMLTLTGCDPMESEIMQDPTFVELLKLFGYKPMDEPAQNEETWMLPCKYTRISSPFGYRTHPVTGEWKLHGGIDLAAAECTPIYASRSGTVVYADWDTGSGGKYVSIDHGDGLKSQYLHMTDKMEFVVKKGQKVQQGELIGYVGDTGVTTGFHLHFVIKKYNEEIKDWEPVDPELYLHFPGENK
jgi:murein DD-endopeptidase MepM/ murein hydrolase activator NlpD